MCLCFLNDKPQMWALPCPFRLLCRWPPEVPADSLGVVSSDSMPIPLVLLTTGAAAHL